MSARLTDRQRADRAVSEDEMQRLVTDIAGVYGYAWMHVDPLRTSGGLWRTPTHGPLGKGWPDTVLVSRSRQRIVFAELKRELGTVSADQAAVLAFLDAAGFEAHVVRPSTFDAFVEVLRS